VTHEKMEWRRDGWSPLTRSISIWEGARVRALHHTCKTLAAAFLIPSRETLAARAVLTHWCMAFLPVRVDYVET
jgi:hypothetical protein